MLGSLTQITPDKRGYLGDTDTILSLLNNSWNVLNHLEKKTPNELDELEGYSPITLLDGGSADNGGQIDYITLCRDKKLLFQSWQPLWNCLTLATLSLSKDDFPRINDKYFHEIDETASKMGISNISTIDGIGILKDTYACAVASCGDGANCSIPSLPSDNFWESNKVEWDTLSGHMSYVCHNLEGQVNIDVAGPGVIMSYMMQNALALYAWLLLWLFSWGEYANASRRRGRVTLPAGFGRFVDRMEQGNLTNATRTFLVEFHEAECFFIMAISIAILYANSQGAIFNGVENWQSLINTRKSIVTLASTGAMPIVLTQLSLRNSRINSFYCLFLSIVSLLLVGLAADTGLKPDVDSVYDMFKDENNLIDCGNHPSLRTFCLSDGSYATTSAYFQLATLLAYFALISMIVLKIIHRLSERG
ncbi:hypothetical protein EDB80DRAFT_816849 [Ilyonectria destructans]|nr:hypothetical protein EDB80DRAFT_816849 [Ilyonectria destructans]